MRTKYDELGREIPESTPVSLPVGFHKPPTLQDEIKRFVRLELSQRAEANELESFADADDFDVDEDVDLPTRHEIQDMHSERSADAYEVLADDSYRSKKEDEPNEGLQATSGNSADEASTPQTDPTPLPQGSGSDIDRGGSPDSQRQPLRARPRAAHTGVRKKPA